MKVDTHNRLDLMIAWEEGDITPDETIDLFQHLVDSGLAWKLQGCYGRFAHELIMAGRIKCV